jgi:hypothetical protein
MVDVHEGGLPKASGALDSRAWDAITSPAENRTVTRGLAQQWAEIAKRHAKPHKAFGVKRKHRRDLRTDPLMLSKLLVYVAQVLDVPVPDVFLLDDKGREPFQPINALDGDELCPGLLVRPQALSGLAVASVAFLLARALARYRPGYVPSWAAPASETDERWRTGVDETTARAALLVCADLDAALEHAPHLRDHLLDFAVSERYFIAREQLGLTIDG